MTTKEVLAKAELHLVANPNPDGWAQGRLFMDGGEKLSEIENGDYEYYQFHLSAGSLKKWVLNDRALRQAGRGLDSLTIVNAETHANTDFACWISNDETVSAVDFKYDATKLSLTLTDPNGPIDLYKLRNLYYGDSTHDQNLCYGILGHEKQYYKVKDGGSPDLSGTAPLVIPLTNNQPGGHPDLDLTITVTEASIVNIRWNYADKPETVKTPYEVPTNIVNMDLKPGHLPLSDFITWSTLTGNNTGEFSITVKNYLEKDAMEPLFTLKSNMMLNQYLNSWEGTAELRRTPDFQGLMGLPDQTSTDLFLGDGTYSLWNREAADPVETGKYPTENTYGSVPFVMGAASNHTWVGIYSNVAAAQDWEIKNFDVRGVVDIAFYATGGRGDISILQGANPNEVTQTFHQRIVGLPVMTPQWALGFHQSRAGYQNTAALKAVIDNYQAQNLPLDGIWSDIDYMEDYKSFYYDTDNFAGLPTFIKTLYNKHWVPVVTAAIPQRIRSTGGLQPYLPYHDGLDQGIFITASAKIDQPFTGQQYADDAVYVDWSHTNSSVYWDDWLAKLQSEVAFDGVWLDMNEATSFCNGPCYWDQTADQPVQQKLKYIPTGRNLEDGAIALDAVHSDGSTELDVHSLYGTQQTEATSKYFKNTLKKRPMIISRSNFAGQGKFGSRTLGDNFSTGHYMGYSTTGVMASNIAGVPLAGADICGYNGDSNADLCTRWYTVGSFYPFSRNHNARDAADQEPYVFT